MAQPNQRYAQLLPSYTLYGAGASVSDTSLILTSFLDINGTAITMAAFGSKGYGTIEPGSSSKEEQISFTGITANGNGTYTLTGVKTVLFIYPYTETSGISKSHAGGVKFVISNTSGYYNTFANLNNDQTFAGINTFTILPQSAATPSANADLTTKTYVDTADLLAVHKAGVETITGIKTFDTGATPLITDQPTTNLMAANKFYVDNVAVAGAPNASTTVKGIVQEATQAQVTAGTAVGSTGARLFVNPSTLSPQALLASDYSDGSVTISVNTTLSRDMFYDALVVNTGVVLTTGNYRIFARTVTTNGTGKITADGGTGGVGQSATGGSGGTAGTVTAAGSLPAGNAGKVGGNGGNGGVGSNGTAGTASTKNLNDNNGSSGGAGDNGGAGGGTGGAGGATSSSPYSIPRSIVNAYYMFELGSSSSTTISRYNVSPGAGSGGGGGTSGAGGGGSGGGGGSVWIAAETITNAGTISSNGGTGGNGGNATQGGGGGGGGNGGVVFLIYSTLSNTGTISANGGAGGTKGTPGNDGGTNGVIGTNGLVIQITR